MSFEGSIGELVSKLKDEDQNKNKGQPIAHIMQSYGDEISCSIRTYTYIGKGYLTAKKPGMRRVVRYRKRKHKGESAVVSEQKVGRNTKTFRSCSSKILIKRLVMEMDTAEGTKAVSCYIHFVAETFFGDSNDNGLEFANPLVFENGENVKKRTNLYFCEPRMSNQKGSIEKNHEKLVLHFNFK